MIYGMVLLCVIVCAAASLLSLLVFVLSLSFALALLYVVALYLRYTALIVWPCYCALVCEVIVAIGSFLSVPFSYNWLFYFSAPLSLFSLCFVSHTLSLSHVCACVCALIRTYKSDTQFSKKREEKC